MEKPERDKFDLIVMLPLAVKSGSKSNCFKRGQQLAPSARTRAPASPTGFRASCRLVNVVFWRSASAIASAPGSATAFCSSPSLVSAWFAFRAPAKAQAPALPMEFQPKSRACNSMFTFKALASDTAPASLMELQNKSKLQSGLWLSSSARASASAPAAPMAFHLRLSCRSEEFLRSADPSKTAPSSPPPHPIRSRASTAFFSRSLKGSPKRALALATLASSVTEQ
mmetsp:Transcript_127794/g.331303  ORF Transcript_127794/g.331303 Transcript_127794/m.331303 type:complete len:226 (+) Transcript_127794:203-880(+)